jgi:hypothetical protein
MKITRKDIVIFIAELAICTLALILAGCCTSKVTLPDGTEFIHQPFLFQSTANKVEFHYEDPNCVMWVIANDPNRSVSPGKLNIIEPRTGITAGLEAK